MSFTSQKSLKVARVAFFRRSSWAAFGAASVFLFAANGHAEAKPDKYQVAYRQYSTTVSYADLELDRAADAKTFYSRLQAAAKFVCGDADPRNLRALSDAINCYNTALSNAVSDLSNANVTALHRSDPSIRVAQRSSSANRGS